MRREEKVNEVKKNIKVRKKGRIEKEKEDKLRKERNMALKMKNKKIKL